MPGLECDSLLRLSFQVRNERGKVGELSTSSPNIPKFRGLKTFRGDIFHTGLWPDQHVNFTNKSVAILGTGSSGIQAIPEIARDAQRLYVFQRTANYVVPAHNRPLNKKEVNDIKKN